MGAAKNTGYGEIKECSYKLITRKEVNYHIPVEEIERHIAITVREEKWEKDLANKALAKWQYEGNYRADLEFEE